MTFETLVSVPRHLHRESAEKFNALIVLTPISYSYILKNLENLIWIEIDVRYISF